MKTTSKTWKTKCVIERTRTLIVEEPLAAIGGVGKINE